MNVKGIRFLGLMLSPLKLIFVLVYKSLEERT